MSPGTKSVSRDGGRISQRWEDENSEGRTSPGRPAKKGLSVCSTKRVLLELLVVVVLLLWIFMMAFTMASRLEPCQVSPSVRSDLGNRFVTIKSWNGAAHWSVGGDGVLAVGRGKWGLAANTSFHVEWQDKEWFCLRSLADLRLVEVGAAASAQPFVLRTAHYGCSQPAQMFAYRGHSIYSKGAGSFVNMREAQYLRAHGDTLPWSPLQRETRQTRVAVDEAPAAREPGPADFQRKILGLLSSLDR